MWAETSGPNSSFGSRLLGLIRRNGTPANGIGARRLADLGGTAAWVLVAGVLRDIVVRFGPWGGRDQPVGALPLEGIAQYPAEYIVVVMIALASAEELIFRWPSNRSRCDRGIGHVIWVCAATTLQLVAGYLVTVNHRLPLTPYLWVGISAFAASIFIVVLGLLGRRFSYDNVSLAAALCVAWACGHVIIETSWQVASVKFTYYLVVGACLWYLRVNHGFWFVLMLHLAFNGLVLLLAH